MVSGHRGRVDVWFRSQGRRSQSGESHKHAENQVRVVNTQRIRCKMRWREGGGHSCLAFARAGLGYLYVESKVWVTIYATQRKWESGGKGRRNVETWSCLRQTCGIVCEGESSK